MEKINRAGISVCSIAHRRRREEGERGARPCGEEEGGRFPRSLPSPNGTPSWWAEATTASRRRPTWPAPASPSPSSSVATSSEVPPSRRSSFLASDSPAAATSRASSAPPSSSTPLTLYRSFNPGRPSIHSDNI